MSGSSGRRSSNNNCLNEKHRRYSSQNLDESIRMRKLIGMSPFNHAMKEALVLNRSQVLPNEFVPGDEYSVWQTRTDRRIPPKFRDILSSLGRAIEVQSFESRNVGIMLLDRPNAGTIHVPRKLFGTMVRENLEFERHTA